MEWIRVRIDLLGRALALLATYTIVIGGLSVFTSIPGVIDGEIVAICRTVLGIWGVAAGLLVWTLRKAGIDGWQAIMIWSVVQVPLIAWSSDGSPTTQLFDIALGVTSSTTVNGVQTSFEQYGLNAVGIILCIWTARTRDRWDRRVKPVIAEQSAAAMAAT